MNDKEAINRIVESNSGLVRKIINRSYPAYRHDEDLEQTAMIGLWAAAMEWDGTGSFQAFAAACVRHDIIDYIRRLPKEGGELPFDLSTTDQQEEDLQDRINRAWPEGSIENTILSNLAAGVPKREIAERMGVDTYFVTKTARRAVKRVIER